MSKASRLHALATVERDLGNLAQAEANYHVLLRLVPKQIAWRNEYADLLVQRRKFDEAIEQYLILQVRSEDPSRFAHQLETVRRMRRDEQ